MGKATLSSEPALITHEAGPGRATPGQLRGWRQSRTALAAFLALSLWLLLTVLRAVLFVAFRPAAGSGFGEGSQAFLIGLQRDSIVVLGWATLLLIGFLLLPNRWWQSRRFRWLFRSGLFLFWAAQFFQVAAEFFFFEEFRSRFNTVAVDYLIYPHEVFVNLWDSYPVGSVLAGCGALAGLWVWWSSRQWPDLTGTRATRRAERWCCASTAALAGLIAMGVDFGGTRFSKERVLNEIANNGTIAFCSAALTRHLDYGAFYKTMGLPEAYDRVHRLLRQPGAEFTSGSNSIQRHIAGDPARPRLNVVILLEESLGSEFWGSLGGGDRHGKSLTPEMDRLAREEGLLFTNLYATGNRTVRGMEGVLSSFPPLPGDSIVKRDQSEEVETIARVLQRDGYSTTFLYGGRGVFDGMRAFAVNNGYDRFLEQKHFEKPTFTTIWGVCDEDLFARAIRECRDLSRTGQPFFLTTLSVSNHKPYTYPAGRIPEDPAKRKRSHAVKYSDYALGQFFKAARQESFWTNTIFAVVADHGARVYGSQSIPIHSYEIPLLIAGPAVVKQPARIPQLGCSMDVGPTILGLLGRPYDSLFFGRNLLQDGPGDGRVLINHNRDIGLFARDRLIVLGLMQNVEFYGGNPKVAEITRLAEPAGGDHELERDTVALFQVADDLYVHRRYRRAPPTAGSPSLRLSDSSVVGR